MAEQEQNGVIIPKAAAIIFPTYLFLRDKICRIFSGEISGHSCPERFTDEVSGMIGGEQLQGCVRRGVEAALARRTRAIFIARIFDDEDIKRSGLLNRVGVVTALESAAGIAVGDEHLALRRLNGRQPFPADGFTRGTGPTLQIFRGRVFFDFVRTARRREIDHPTLKTGTAEAKDDIDGGTELESPDAPFP